MKHWIVVTIMAFGVLFSAQSQGYTWSFQTNPFFSGYGAANIAMVNGKLYEVHVGGAGSTIDVSEYNPESGNWLIVSSVSVANTTSIIRAVSKNGLIYFVAGSTTDMRVYSFDPLSYNTLEISTTPITYASGSTNWVVKTNDSNNGLFILRTANYTNVYLTILLLSELPH